MCGSFIHWKIDLAIDALLSGALDVNDLSGIFFSCSCLFEAFFASNVETIEEFIELKVSLLINVTFGVVYHHL